MFTCFTSTKVQILTLRACQFLPTLGPLTALVQLSICGLKCTKCLPRAAPEASFDSMPVTAEFVTSGQVLTLLALLVHKYK